MKKALVFLLVLMSLTFASATPCIENECVIIEPGCDGQCPNDVPEFTTVGAAAVVLGATAFLIRRRK